MLKRLGFVLLLGVSLANVSTAVYADTFGSGANTFEIEFVTIGDAGNAGDTTGDPDPAGAVAYEYRIGKYEISEQMIDKANALGGLGIAKDTRGPDKPATRVSWFEAAQFVNWLNTSKGSTPAYKFDDQGDFQLWEPSDPGYDPSNLFRNTEARYFIPSADEWYKAAFFDPVTDQYFDFPNGSDTPPLPVANGMDPNTAVYEFGGPSDILLSGGPSPFGTVAQAGNVWEWEESEGDLVNDDPQAVRGFRGSGWGGVSGNPIGLSSSFRQQMSRLPKASVGDLGFRVASIVPEPTSFWLFTSCGIGLLLSRRFLA